MSVPFLESTMPHGPLKYDPAHPLSTSKIYSRDDFKGWIGIRFSGGISNRIAIYLIWSPNFGIQLSFILYYKWTRVFLLKTKKSLPTGNNSAYVQYQKHYTYVRTRGSYIRTLSTFLYGCCFRRRFQRSAGSKRIRSPSVCEIIHYCVRYTERKRTGGVELRLRTRTVVLPVADGRQTLRRNRNEITNRKRGTTNDRSKTTGGCCGGGRWWKKNPWGIRPTCSR